MTEGVSPKKAVKEHCPNCAGERNCEVHGSVNVPWTWSDEYDRHSVSGGDEHFLLQCRGCDIVFYLRSSWHEDDVEHWRDHAGEMQTAVRHTKFSYPTPERRIKPDWLTAIGKTDRQLNNILSEMYVAMDSKAFILTAVGLRTALDRATEVLGIDPAKTFSEKLSKLLTDGWIGTTERDVLEVVTNAGNAAAHRGWAPDEEEVGQLIDAMEAFLLRAFIVGNKVLDIKGSIPQKPKRKKA